jgi:energy-coupling factor transporter ATP-binding protein EcfA2
MDEDGSASAGNTGEPNPQLASEFLFDPAEFGAEAAEDAAAATDVFSPIAASRESGASGPPPRITKIRLANILGFKESTIYPERYTVMVGANNSGKSSLMRAVNFAQTLLRVHVERDEPDRVVLANGRNLGDQLLPVPAVRDLWHQGVRRVGNEWVMAEVEVEFDDGLVLGFGMKGPFGHATSRLLDSSSREISREAFDRINAFPIVYVPSSVGVVDREEYRTPARILSLIAGGRAHEVLRNLLLDLQKEHRLGEVADVIAEYFSGTINDVSFAPDIDEYIHVSYKEDSDHDLFSAGAGFLQVLQLVTFLVHERPGILMVDEPDAHLHSSLQRLVVDVLRAASQELGIQVLLATHSKEIINYVDPSELLVIDRHKEQLRGLGRHEGAISVLESLGSIDSVDAYQVISQRKLLLVEGGSDRKTLRALAAGSGSRIFEGESRLVVIDTGGESTPEARADLSILEKMLDGEITSLQILDRDARLDEFVERAEESSSRPLHIWRFDSIESYLIAPGAIGRLVSNKNSDTNPATVEAFVESRVLEAIDELRDETLDRIGTRYRRDVIDSQGRNVEPKEANEAAREAMKDPDLLRRLTRGKSLLAAVRKGVHDEFGVSFGNQALIAEMEEDEMDPELVEVLNRVEGLAG